MIEIKLSFATVDDALSAVLKLSGVTGAVGVLLPEATWRGDDETAKPKKETPAAKAAAATKEAFTEEKPAKAKGKAAKAKVVSIDDLKKHILSHAGESADQPEKIKEYVRTFGVIKISDMTEAQRQEAFDGAEEYFAGGEEAEEDPMA